MKYAIADHIAWKQIS